MEKHDLLLIFLGNKWKCVSRAAGFSRERGTQSTNICIFRLLNAWPGFYLDNTTFFYKFSPYIFCEIIMICITEEVCVKKHESNVDQWDSSFAGITSSRRSRWPLTLKVTRNRCYRILRLAQREARLWLGVDQSSRSIFMSSMNVIFSLLPMKLLITSI